MPRPNRRAGSSIRETIVARPMTSRYYIEPLAFLSGAAAVALIRSGEAVAVGGEDLACGAIRIHERLDKEVRLVKTVLCSRLGAWQAETGIVLDKTLRMMARARPAFAGLDLRRPAIMGVLNVTPDSFSDGGEFSDPSVAIAHGEQMLAAGADVVDVGGESTRPGAEPVSEEDEIRRVVPVVEALANRGALVSIDTRKARVMEEAIRSGARIVNDVSALTGDPESLGVVARSKASVILMHMRGEPRTMQDAPTYTHVLTDVFDVLEGRVAACLEAGIEPGRIAVDPGIGFGKSMAHNLRLIDGLGTFQSLGCVVALGVSRKGFIGRLGGAEAVKDRFPGSLALGLAGIQRGARLLRVHDVRETRQALSLWEAVTSVTCACDEPS